MSTFPVLAITIAVLLTTLGRASSAPTPCFNDLATFADYCKTVLQGVPDGGRCFFAARVDPNTGDTWKASWPVCEAYGAGLAQIHTAQEYNKVMAYMKAFWVTNGTVALMFGLMDAVTLPGFMTCVFKSSTLYYYKDDSTPDLPVVSDTYLAKTHACDDRVAEGVPRCFRFWGPLYFDHFGQVGIDDYKCKDQTALLCQFTNPHQSYTLTANCMGLTPTQTVSGNTGTDCATACSATAWCRSYNFIQSGSGNTCELFTWVSADSASTKAVTGCSHYDYVG